MPSFFRRIVRGMINRSPALFTLEQRIKMLPATMAGPAGGAARSWSQYGEDNELVESFKDILQTGFYVDVGANHPSMLSNTYRLYCLGMRGLCVEPNDALARLLARYRPGDLIVNAAIGPQPALLKFHEMSYHGLSTFSQADAAERVKKGVRIIRESFKPMFPLSTLLRDCAPKDRSVFALLSVDVEGWDEVVLRSNDWERYRPRLVLAESNEEQAATGIRRFLESVGYTQTKTFGVNGLFADNAGATRSKAGGAGDQERVEALLSRN